MSQAVLPEVFTADEVARAARVDALAVRAFIASGEVKFIAGTTFIAASDALRIGRRLRADAARRQPRQVIFSAGSGEARSLRRRAKLPVYASSLAHVSIVAVILWLGTRTLETAPVDDGPRPETHLVFVMSPGPDGGGGGGGLRNPLPVRRVERRSVERPRVSVPEVTPKPVITTPRPETPKEPTPAPTPKPVERAPEPLAARVLVAPVVATAADSSDRDGAVESATTAAASQGSGAGGGAGTGQGTGSGEGSWAGIGEGSGGGFGGGPYRPGSGIEPPRLVREVKAEYTDEARRRGITGDVVLEIVVRRDGSVGEVTLRRGLGGGLDQRAVTAVRQWRFDPARRRGVPVDVIVEVAVEFTLR